MPSARSEIITFYLVYLYSHGAGQRAQINLMCENGFEVDAFFIDDSAPPRPPVMVTANHFRIFYPFSEFDTFSSVIKGTPISPPLAIIFLDDADIPTSGCVAGADQPAPQPLEIVARSVPVDAAAG